MQIQREDLNPCTVRLEITCDPEQVKVGFEKAYKQAAKKIKVPGFRPGHAPRAILEQSVNPEYLKELATENIIRDAYKQATEQLELKPYSTGSVDLKTLEQEESKCEFVAKVPLQPVVEIGDYTTIPVQKPEATVTDEEIEQQLQDLRKRHSTREAVKERGAEEGDVALVNIKVDSEEGDGRNFMTVVGKTFPQLDQALMGMKIEDMKELDLNYPEKFEEKDWAGKMFHSRMTLRSLSTTKLPELEDVAKTLNTETPEELKEKVRKLLERQKEEAVAEYVNEQLIEELMKRSNVCVPDTMWENVANQKLADVMEKLQERNVTLEDYCKERGMTAEEFIKAQKEEAKTFVMRAQLIQDLYLKENMTVSNLDLNAELAMMAQEYRMRPDELLQTLKKSGALKELQYQAIHRKVMDFLNQRAEVREVAHV